MFSPRVGSTRPGTSPFTPTSKSGRSASKRVANVFTPQKKQKGQQNRSVLQASQLIEETPNFRIEKYGMPLPVLITEVLTFADRTSKISVQIEDSGWAWLVGGRKLFVWRYKQAPTGRNVLCKELTLPPSDLAHSADRVCVIPSSGDHQAAACIAVSPEGVVRYWSNIAYESSYMEVSAELKGEECACVVNLQPYGFLLATTTSSLVLLTTTPGQNNVVVKPIKAAQGMFAGFGRRMSSLIFGGGPGQATGATLQAVISGHYEEDERPFYLLSGAHFQKWLVDDYSPEKFLYQLDADRLFRQDLARQIWDKDAVQMPQLVTWILDMKLTRDGVVFLGAGLDLESEPLVHFAVATLVTNVSGTPSKLDAFKVLSFKRRYQEDMENEILSYKLLMPDRNREETYLYNTTHVVIDTGNGADSEELPLPGGCQLGAGVCENTAVFFSISQGLISIASTQKPEMSILDDQTQERMHDLSSLSTNMTQIQELSMSEDKPSRLKAAFLAACAGNLKYAQEVVDELFPDSMVTSETQTTEIDRLVVGLSRNLIDDYPSSDPRWAENTKTEGGGSSSLSLIILQQLEDKKRAHGYILNFLKKTNIWDKLRTVKLGDRVISTRLLLCQHAEKVESAIVLRQMHTEYGDVINPAISKALNFRGEQWTQGLSPHDVFYRQVSLVHEIVEALLEYESNIMGGNFKPSEILMVIAAVNPVLEGMFYAALSYRHEKAQDYHSRTPLQPEPEYIPWTSTVGNSGIRTLILRQFMLTLETAVPEASDMETKGQLFKQLQGLADTVLDGYTSQLASLTQNPDMAEYMSQVEEKFHQDRRALISPFLEHKQFEKAGSLAEKYCDFEMLISICDATGNQERIHRYQQQFADRGFSDFLFSWYMKEGKRGRLMSLPIPQQSKLRDFLQQDELGYLKWLHDIEQKDFRSAHDTLLQLGRNEEQFLAKKKTLLSLSKLCALAYEGNDEEMQENIRNIDEEQELIINQELLPDKLLERLNIDPEHMRVLTPAELIQDFSNLEMERYQNGGVNITGFQLVNYNSTFNKAFLELWSTLNPNIYVGSGNKSIHIDAALAVDSLTVIQKTLSKLMANSTNVFKHTFRRGEVYNYNKTKGVPCTSDPPTPWMHGEALMRGIKSLAFEGVTGHIEFDDAGFRKNYTLEIYNVGLNKKYKIGNWYPHGGVYTNTYEHSGNGSKKGNVKIWKVTSIAGEPFLKRREGPDKKGKPYVGNARYEGYCVDLAKHISKSIGFDYIINEVKDNAYGANITATDGSDNGMERWNGMIGELLRGEADIAIAGLSITREREEIVDFSKPFMDVGISIMIKKPEKKTPGVFSFMQPFTIDLWACIVLGYFSVAICIFLVSRFSSAEWRPSRINPNFYNKFTIANSMWFAMG